MKFRSRSVLAKLVSLLALPLITLVVLWAIAASVALSDAVTLLAVSGRSNEIGFPGATLAEALQVERKISVVDVGAGRRNSAELAAARKTTDRAYANFKRKALDNRYSDGLRPELDALVDAARELPEQRAWIDTGASPRMTVADYFSGLIAKIFTTLYALGAVHEPGRGHRSDGLLEFGEAAEIFSQESAIVAGALAAGSFQPDEYDRTVGLINTRRYLLVNVQQKYPPEEQEALAGLDDPSENRRLSDMEDSIIRDGSRTGRPPINAADWDTTSAAVTKAYADFSRGAALRFTEFLKPTGYRTIALLVIAGLLGLIAVVVSILVSIRIARSLVAELVGVQRSAQNLASVELPAVVRRLRAGESVDVNAEVQPMSGFTIREVASVAAAMDAARSTAVEVAVEEADLRRGVREVFLNLARRSQALVHRQLTLLDAMERREKEPDELEDLFQLDHLATRMRRHAEDLIVLSGSTPGRGWRNPVPLIDVMRGAVAEVEDYARVRVIGATRTSLAGRGVSDVIHLLAELIENATTFSPPHTTVHVSGELVPAGFAIEIEDRGLGMPADQLETLNARLAEPPEFDLLHSERLGLFVVGQLARRHEIKVVLRGSPFGGTTAIVLLPAAMVITPEQGRHRTPPVVTPAQDVPPTLSIAPLPVESVPTAAQSDRASGGAFGPDEAVAALEALNVAPPVEPGEQEAAPAGPYEEPPARPYEEPAAWPAETAWRPRSPEPASQSDPMIAAAEAAEANYALRADYGPSALSTGPRHAATPSPAPNGSGNGTPPLVRRDPGAGWENLTSNGPTGLPRRERQGPRPDGPAAPPEPAPEEPPAPGPGSPMATRESAFPEDPEPTANPTPPASSGVWDVDFRPRGVARAPLASRAVRDTPDDEPAADATPADGAPAERSLPAERGLAELAAANGLGGPNGPGLPNGQPNGPGQPNGLGGPVRSAEAPPAPNAPGGLPRRVRQANLAAPLREGSGMPQAPIEPTTTRSPEEIRAVMGSYQRGSVLGRENAARTISAAEEPPDETTGESARSDEVPAGRGMNNGALEGER
ncbi:nitrate- and nitrite sensing domain-containing protein [Cryptosporangium sp. NPDC051539]|uniref:sensor histidine kinase n=1 Tax=Cryptosporangium sp. NPDC051539 TaxID=3363962 RepID=UPI0037A25CD4